MKWGPLEPDNTVAAWHGKRGGTKLEAEGRLEGLAMCQGSSLKTYLLVEFRGAPAFTSCSTMAGVSDARLVTVYPTE